MVCQYRRQWRRQVAALSVKRMGNNRKKPLTAAQLTACHNLKRIWEAKAVALGLTQESAAGSLGVTQGAVGNMLHGRLAISLKSLTRWTAILQVPASEIDPVLAKKYPSLGAHGGFDIDPAILEKSMRILEESPFRDHPLSQRADMLVVLYNAIRASAKNPEASLSALLPLISTRGKNSR